MGTDFSLTIQNVGLLLQKSFNVVFQERKPLKMQEDKKEAVGPEVVDRVRGVLIGLLSGDQNGGPVRKST